MKHGDANQSVTHVSDVNRYPCSGLNTVKTSQTDRCVVVTRVKRREGRREP